MRKPLTQLLQSRARAMRKAMTHEEVKLWVQLKSLSRSGFHFRRQVPLDGYILDFAEFGQRMIIEVDGPQHSSAAHYDRFRDSHFAKSGFRILRFWNIDVHQNMDGVTDTILAAARPHPAR